MKILNVHGWNSVVGGAKPTYLKSHGHEVIEPAPHQHQPDVQAGTNQGVCRGRPDGRGHRVERCPRQL